jgi:UDP-GlcNAc:undecaprenyl-phosphate/decaprenyl-phosphate GlcNAc-1-phosphate transferase
MIFLRDCANAAAAMLLAFAASWLLNRLVLRYAPRLGLIDLPSERKVHNLPVPKGGGLAIYAAVALSQAVASFRFADAPVLLGIGIGIVILGLVDDRYALPWQFRLGVQAALALAALAALGAIGVDERRFWLPWPLAWVWVVGLTNAFNMLDNMDALSAGTAFIVCVLSAGLCVLTGFSAGKEAVLMYLVLAGALAGFLVYNRPPARMFMGDAGSTFLGFFLGMESLRATAPADRPLEIAGTAFCLLAIPLYDMVTVITIRLLQGRSPFHADKQHLSHRLTDLGLSQAQSVMCILVCGAVMGLAGITFRQFGPAAALTIALSGWTIMLTSEFALHKAMGRRVAAVPREPPVPRTENG